ncbi:MAG: hypothetical protein ACLR0N_04610 [Bilophila wadsworthia]
MKATRGQPGNAVVVFMHDRPRRYLRERFRYAPDVPKPCLIPRMFTERELMAAFRQEQHQKLRREAGKLDQIALLSRCVRELAEPDTELCMQLAKTDDADFSRGGCGSRSCWRSASRKGSRPRTCCIRKAKWLLSGRPFSARSARFSAVTATR